MAHSPTPWYHDSWDHLVILDANGQFVAQTFREADEEPSSAADSNAALLLHAPMLKERLQQVTRTIQEFLDGLWDGSDEGWQAVIDANRDVLRLALGATPGARKRFPTPESRLGE